MAVVGWILLGIVLLLLFLLLVILFLPICYRVTAKTDPNGLSVKFCPQAMPKEALALWFKEIGERVFISFFFTQRHSVVL